jgi:predicted nucleotidyltransferase
LKLPADFRDVLACLRDAEAEFMVIGGFAVAHHGHVRATKDIDVFVGPPPAVALRWARRRP